MISQCESGAPGEPAQLYLSQQKQLHPHHHHHQQLALVDADVELRSFPQQHHLLRRLPLPLLLLLLLGLHAAGVRGQRWRCARRQPAGRCVAAGLRQSTSPCRRRYEANTEFAWNLQKTQMYTRVCIQYLQKTPENIKFAVHHFKIKPCNFSSLAKFQPLFTLYSGKFLFHGANELALGMSHL